MPMISRISPVRAQNPIVGFMNINAASKKATKATQQELLKDTFLTPSEFKKMLQGKNSVEQPVQKIRNDRNYDYWQGCSSNCGVYW